MKVVFFSINKKVMRRTDEKSDVHSNSMCTVTLCAQQLYVHSNSKDAALFEEQTRVKFEQRQGDKSQQNKTCLLCRSKIGKTGKWEVMYRREKK